MSNEIIAAPARALTPIKQIEGMLNSKEMQASLEKNLPRHITPERFARVAIMALQKSPKLADPETDRASLYQAIQACAQDGLLPDGREAALVPFSGKVQYLPMVAGILKKARNSGEIATIHAQTVHKNDPFKFFVDEHGPHLDHRPDLLAADRGPLIGVYALAVTKDGGSYLEVMSRADVEKVKAVSRASSKGPWVDWEEQMWEKSALKALGKRLPMSTDILGVIEREEEREEAPVEGVDLETPPTPAPNAGSKTREAVLGTDAATQEAIPL